MRKLLFIPVLLFTVAATFAQPGNKRDKIEAAKAAYITSRINLTPEQSERFWPIYNEHNTERREIRREMGKLSKENKTADEEKMLKNIEKREALKQKMLNADKAYRSKYLKVIDAKQLAALYKAEQEFKEKLLRELQKRKGEHREK